MRMVGNCDPVLCIDSEEAYRQQVTGVVPWHLGLVDEFPPKDGWVLPCNICQQV